MRNVAVRESARHMGIDHFVVTLLRGKKAVSGSIPHGFSHHREYVK
jgi:hypothetical protein